MISNKIIDYYNQCHKDYQNFWRINKNLSMHFGFYNKDYNTHDDAVINMNRVLAKIVKITSNDKILDAGCGIGGSSIWLAKNFGSCIIGIDINKIHIEIARKFAKENKVDKLVQFAVRNFVDTKFPKNHFDVIWGIESICYAENKKDFLSEAKKILKNHGRIIIADGFLKKEDLSNNEKKYVNKWCDGWAVPNLARINEFQKYLKQLGYINIKFIEITKNVMPSSRRVYLASLFVYPTRKVLELMGLRTRTQIKSAISAYYQYKILKNIGVYGIFYAEKNKLKVC